ncbi:MAG: hypothetical protein Q8920_15770 [Bacillota bacterium]|nr:hypothetical protein [Bacillota bacterium]
MIRDSVKVLTYVLANGDERTIALNKKQLHDFLTWYRDSYSSNTFDFGKDAGEQTTLFKNTLLSVRY